MAKRSRFLRSGGGEKANNVEGVGYSRFEAKVAVSERRGDRGFCKAEVAIEVFAGFHVLNRFRAWNLGENART